jgi:hypothetical protein
MILICNLEVTPALSKWKCRRAFAPGFRTAGTQFDNLVFFGGVAIDSPRKPQLYLSKLSVPYEPAHCGRSLGFVGARPFFELHVNSRYSVCVGE